MTTTSTWFNRLGPRTLAGQRTVIGYIFIMPFILGFLLWFLAPALTAVWLTFQDWNLISPPKFVGVANLRRLPQDDLFWQALKVTFNFTLISVPVGLVLGFLLALLLNTKVRGIAFFRTAYY